MEERTQYLDQIVVGALFLVILIPLFFMPFLLRDFYDLAKVSLFRLITLVILGAWLLKLVYTGKFVFRRTPLDLPLLAFLLFLLLSTIFSVNPRISTVGILKRHEGLLTWISYIVLYFAATNFLKDRRQAERFLVVLIISSIPLSLYGIFQHFGWDFIRFAEGVDLTRSFSTLGNPVFLGAYLSVVIPLAVISLARKNSLNKRVFFGNRRRFSLGLFGVYLWPGSLARNGRQPSFFGGFLSQRKL